LKVTDTISFHSSLLDIKVDGQSKLLQLTKRLGGGKYKLRFLGTVVGALYSYVPLIPLT